MVNFLNPADNALETAAALGVVRVSWRRNQELKPDQGYDYNRRRNEFIRMPRAVLLFPADTHEIFAHCAEARSRALGAEQGGHGPIGDEFDISTRLGAGFDFTDAPVDHSGQFRSFFMRRGIYWRQLLDTFRLNPNLN